jgi:hypothetical protein
MNYAPKFLVPPVSLSSVIDHVKPSLDYSIRLSEILEDTGMKSLTISSSKLG